jgi:predicted nucleic acid-binding protein
VASLVDTNVLVYRHDERDRGKQGRAYEVLRQGVAAGALRIAHQSVIEFVSATTRPQRGGAPLLEREEALREAEELLTVYPVLYPDDEVVRLALRGAAAYGLSWYDAHLWACAERFGLDELISEDFEHGRMYGTVRVVDPFLEAGP